MQCSASIFWAGFRFIVGSETSKAPYDQADHLDKHGNAFDDGQTIMSLGVGSAEATAYGCDLTQGYIDENAAYYSS